MATDFMLDTLNEWVVSARIVEDGVEVENQQSVRVAFIMLEGRHLRESTDV
jgi:hypothetical protein